MSLQVWLPLNGDLTQQGLSGVEATNNGATINNEGKIGKCYQFGLGKYIKIIDYASEFLTYETFSLSVWFKCTAQNTSHTGSALISSGNWNAAANLLNLALGNFNSDHYTKILISGSGNWGNGYNYNFYLNTWYHIVLTSGNGAMRVYVNGELIGDSYAAFTPNTLEQTWVCIGNGTYNQSFPFYGLMNDVRIYDHCLSVKEVKELSKGLVLHYKLDKIKQTLINAYTYPTFNTSSVSGGWSHWGRTNAVGTNGQNQDKQYIFRPEQQYSHWVANASTATMDTGGYLFYQSPAFEGGYRSIQCIVKEENSLPITEEIVMPAWNGRNGGAEQNIWTSIESLGNGFYLCKCEGISQDGSNDLIGFYIGPGYKVYFSEAYCEDDKEKCTNIFSLEDFELDSSGYNYNGEIIGSLENDNSNRYNYSTKSTNGANNYIIGPVMPSSIQSYSCWIKGNKSAGFIAFGDSVNELAFGFVSGNAYSSCYSKSKQINLFSGTNFINNEWNHIVVINDGTNHHLYINGVETSTISSKDNFIHNDNHLYLFRRNYNTNYVFNGSISDFRAYATVLSDDDILELYHTAASVDNHGNVYAGEIKEV